MICLPSDASSISDEIDCVPSDKKNSGQEGVHADIPSQATFLVCADCEGQGMCNFRSDNKVLRYF